MPAGRSWEEGSAPPGSGLFLQASLPRHISLLDLGLLGYLASLSKVSAATF